MADGNVVGAIFLDLRISTGIEKQIKEAANKANKIAEKEFESINETLSNAINPGKAIEKSLNAVENQVSKHLENTFSKAGEKVKAALEDSIDMSDKELEEIMNRISFESFETKRTPATPEEMEEFMRPMEWSGKAGPSSELLEQMEKVEEKAKRLPEVFKASNDPVQLLRDKIGNINLQIDEQTKKLQTLTAKYSELSDDDMGTEIAEKLGSAITSTEGRLISLQQTLISTQAKLDKVTAQTTTKVESAGERIRAKTKRVFENTRQTIDKSMKSAGNSINKFAEGVNKRVTRLGRSVQRALKSAFLMFFLYSAFRGFRELVGGALKSNEQFSASVNRLKANLMAAFAPIMNVVIPAVTRLVSALANGARVLATFVASAFGMTYKESLKMAEGINKAAKKAKGSLAGFDELNVMGDEDKGIDFEALGEQEGVISSIGTKIKKALEPLQNINLTNLIAAFVGIREAAQPLAESLFKGLQWLYERVLAPLATWVINSAVPNFLNMISSGMAYVNAAINAAKPAFDILWEGFLQPIAQWTGGIILDVIELIRSGYERMAILFEEKGESITNVLTTIAELFGFLWENVEPVLSNIWALVRDVFDNLSAFLIESFGNFMDKLSGWIDIIKGVFTGDWKRAWDGIKQIFSSTLNQIKAAASFFWELIVEVFSYAWKNLKRPFESAGKFFADVWKGIKNAFGDVADWFKDVFSRAWTNVMNVFSKGGKIFNGIKDGLSDVFKTVVNGLITGINAIIAAPFKTINSMLNKIRNISFLGISPFKKLWEENPLPVPEIPKLARGGIIEQPTLAMIGERGREAVVPLENNTGWIEKLARVLMDLMIDGDDRASGDIIVPIYLGGEILTEFLIDSQRRVAIRSNGRGLG